MEFRMRKRKGAGVDEYLQKEAIGARHSDPTREANLNTIKTMNDQYKKIGAVPPPRAKDKASVVSASTMAEMAASTAQANTTITGKGLNPHYEVYSDYDTKIRPLHPAFNPVPSYRYQVEIGKPM